jgi:hypothetical protein
MSDVLDSGRHFLSPKVWLFEAEREFQHAREISLVDPVAGPRDCGQSAKVRAQIDSQAPIGPIKSGYFDLGCGGKYNVRK